MKKGIKTIKIHQPTIILFIFVLCSFLLWNFNISLKEREPLELQNVMAMGDETYEKVFISRVIDGDTFETRNKKIIRLIGINTPENTKVKERFGDIATKYARENLEGKYVFLEKDISETDKYERYLRNVWLKKPTDLEKEDFDFIKENNFAAKLLSLGYAKTMTIEPDTKLEKIYKKIAEQSKEEGKGLWGFNSITKGDF